MNCPLFLNCTVTVLVDVSHARILPLPPFKPATSDVFVFVVESTVCPTSISVPLLPVIVNWKILKNSRSWFCLPYLFSVPLGDSILLLIVLTELVLRSMTGDRLDTSDDRSSLYSNELGKPL